MPSNDSTSPLQPHHTDNNIGAMRYLLALAVFVAHFNLLSGADIPFPVTSYQGVCGFFAISGFLIFKSFHHADGNIPRYLYKRCLRILPSYFTVVIAATLLLSAVASIPPADYFSSSTTWRYLAANIAFANFLEPSLPGVFESGVSQAVNGSLWTMKVELTLYLTLPLVAWFILRRGIRPWIVIATVYVVSVAYRWGFRLLYDNTGTQLYEILSRQFFGQMTYFYMGALLYCYFDRLRRLLPAIAACSAVIVIAVYAVGLDSEVYYYAVSPLVLSALILSLSLAGNHLGAIARLNDCSYEIYLFHYPIIQTFVHSSLADTMPRSALFIIALATTLLASTVCARFISTPLRRRLAPKR